MCLKVNDVHIGIINWFSCTFRKKKTARKGDITQYGESIKQHYQKRKCILICIYFLKVQILIFRHILSINKFI